MTFDINSDTQTINQALFKVTHGLYILTARREDKLNGQCLDALMQVTNMPPQMAIGVGKRTLTHEMIEATGIFNVNVLCRDDPACYDMVKHFGFQSGRKVNKFETVAYELGSNGLPILPNTLAFYECTVIADKTLDLDTHTLYIGAVLRAGTREGGEPLTYNEYRKTFKKGG